MNVFEDFHSAANAAFAELKTGTRQLVVVVPGAERKSWRLMYGINKAALRTEAQLLWVSMWEQLSKAPADERARFLWERLKQLVSEQHEMALRAIHGLEFADDEIIRSNKGVGRATHKEEYVSDDTGYGAGGENYEHDNTGASSNYSGCKDDAYNAIKEHEDWKKGYDY